MAVLGGGAIGSVALLASVTTAVGTDFGDDFADGIFEKGALAAGGDAGSTFVTAAQRGEVVPPEIEDIEQMCALLTSCPSLPLPPNVIPKDFGACVAKMSSDMTRASSVFYSLTIRECGLNAQSCEQLKNCVLRGVSKDACNGRATSGDPVGVCVADDKTGKDFAVTCWQGNVLSVRDCTRGNETCQVHAPKDCGKADCSAQSRCVLGPCGDIKEGDKPQCSKSGTHIVHCEHGKLVSLDCAAFGLKCAVGDEGKAGCATGSKTCSGSAKRCEGDVSVGCFNGHEVRVDCKKAGLTCNASGASSQTIGDCVAPPEKNGCDPKDPPKCGGKGDAYIQYCYAGKARQYFCKPLFNRCETKGGVRCQ